MNTLNQESKKYTFDVSAQYHCHLAYIFMADFKKEWEESSLLLENYLVFFASEEVKNAPYYKKSNLAKMKKQELYDLCESYDYYSVGEDSTKADCIEFLLDVTNLDYYKHMYDNNGYREYDYDFTITGYSQGDIYKVKLVGTDKQFKNGDNYKPSEDYLINLYFDTPVNGWIEIGEELEQIIYFSDVQGFNQYDYWDKDDFITKFKNDENMKSLEFFNELVEYLNENLEKTLETY